MNHWMHLKQESVTTIRVQHFMVSLENLFLLSLHICTDDEKRRVIVSYGDDDGRRRMCGNM